jgi:hypothetical protein
LIEKLKDMPPESQVVAPRYDGVGGEEWCSLESADTIKAEYDSRWGSWSVSVDGKIVVSLT